MSNVQLKFLCAAEIFRGCINIPCELLKIFMEFFETVKFEFFSGNMSSTLRGGCTRYLLWTGCGHVAPLPGATCLASTGSSAHWTFKQKLMLVCLVNS